MNSECGPEISWYLDEWCHSFCLMGKSLPIFLRNHTTTSVHHPRVSMHSLELAGQSSNKWCTMSASRPYLLEVSSRSLIDVSYLLGLDVFILSVSCSLEPPTYVGPISGTVFPCVGFGDVVQLQCILETDMRFSRANQSACYLSMKTIFLWPHVLNIIKPARSVQWVGPQCLALLSCSLFVDNLGIPMMILRHLWMTVMEVCRQVPSLDRSG